MVSTGTSGKNPRSRLNLENARRLRLINPENSRYDNQLLECSDG